MAITQDVGMAVPQESFTVRAITTDDLRIALRQGWEDFNEKRGDLIFAGIIYPVVGFIVAAFAMNRSLIPVIFPLMAGLTILGPAVASGFYELAKRREQGKDSSWWHFLDVFKSPQLPDILTLAGILGAVFGGWIVAALLIHTATMGPALPTSVGGFLRDVFTTPGGWAMIIAGNLAGLGFAMIALLVSAVSFPMLVDKPVSWADAMSVSMRAMAKNPGVMLRWGLTVAALLVIGSIPFFVGLAVVLPVLGYATWHLYTRVVVR